MKRTFKIVSIVLTVAILFSVMPMAYAVENENAMTLEDFLEENDIMPSDTLEVYVVTDADDKQYIKTVEHLSDGNIAVNFLSCVDEVNGEIIDIKILPDAQTNTTIEVPRAGLTRASTPLSENISRIGITITVTAYYTTQYIWADNGFMGTVYIPSGVTAKWSRSSGSNTVTSLTYYFQMTGDLYRLNGSDGTFIESNSPYLANDTVTSPTANLTYSKYISLGTNMAMYPYGANTVTSSSGIAFSAVVNNDVDDPYEYAIVFPY